MSDLSEYIKHTRHYDGLGMGDQDLEWRAAKLEAERDRYRAALEEGEMILDMLTEPNVSYPALRGGAVRFLDIARKALGGKGDEWKQED